MDLSTMTREELEREAKLRGMRDVHQLSRGQLIRALSAPTVSGAIDTAKAIFRGVLGVARTLRGRSVPPPAERWTPVARSPSFVSEAPTPAAVELAQAAVAPTAVASEQASSAAVEPPSAVTAPAPAPATGELTDEPIPTRTMARLLHEQGHHRRALAILENLLVQHPSDVGLETQLTAVRQALGLPLTSFAPDAKTTPSPRAELVTMLLPDRRVLLAWGLSAESIASARTMGASGMLVARVLVLAPAGSDDVTRTQTDKEVQPTGEHTFGPIAPGSFVTAAVGFRTGDQFVSVAAAPVLDVV